MTAPTIFWVDGGTTGLDPSTHELWEIALIERRPESVEDIEHHWFMKPRRLSLADPAALALNGFYERTAGFHDSTTHPDGTSTETGWTGCKTVCAEIARLTVGGVIVGSNPGFDVTFLTTMMRALGFMPAWHYRPIDVATLAYGYELGRAAERCAPGEPPSLIEWVRHPRISSTTLAELHQVPRPGDAHTAMADARWARDWYDRLIGGAA